MGSYTKKPVTLFCLKEVCAKTLHLTHKLLVLSMWHLKGDKTLRQYRTLNLQKADLEQMRYTS